MANTLGNPTLSTAAREQVVIGANTLLAATTTNPNPILRLKRVAGGVGTLVDFPLNATNPLTVGGSDGSATVNPTSASAVATGGSASLPDAYDIIGRDGVVHYTGAVTATDAITSGQTVTLGTTTITMPAS